MIVATSACPREERRRREVAPALMSADRRSGVADDGIEAAVLARRQLAVADHEAHELADLPRTADPDLERHTGAQRPLEAAEGDHLGAGGVRVTGAGQNSLRAERTALAATADRDAGAHRSGDAEQRDPRSGARLRAGDPHHRERLEPLQGGADTGAGPGVSVRSVAGCWRGGFGLRRRPGFDHEQERFAQPGVARLVGLADNRRVDAVGQLLCLPPPLLQPPCFDGQRAERLDERFRAALDRRQ